MELVNNNLQKVFIPFRGRYPTCVLAFVLLHDQRSWFCDKQGQGLLLLVV